MSAQISQAPAPTQSHPSPTFARRLSTLFRSILTNRSPSVRPIAHTVRKTTPAQRPNHAAGSTTSSALNITSSGLRVNAAALEATSGGLNTSAGGLNTTACGLGVTSNELNATSSGLAMRESVCRAIPHPVAAILTAGLGTILTCSTACAQTTLYQASFDSGTEGWTAQEYNGFCPVGLFIRNVNVLDRVADGGAPGGFLRSIEPAVGGSAFWKAPPQLLAALPAGVGGTLSYQTRTTQIDGTAFTGVQDAVTIVGNGLTLIAVFPLPPVGPWVERVIPLDASAWRVGNCSGRRPTPAEFTQTLTTATSVFIVAERISGRELDDLDSVRIVAPPSPAPVPPPSCGEPGLGIVLGVTTTGSGGWRWIDNDEPTRRWGHTLAVDTLRNVMVLYGGFTGETDTWEYPLSASGPRVWRRTASDGPGPRAFHAMAYDAARQKVVLTGGRYAPIVGFPEYNATAEVWEYSSDGTTGTWVRSPEPLPQARAGGHAMVYDTARDTLVLYGGLGSGVAGATDVLERGPASGVWIARATTINPGAVVGHAMAYDASRQRVVLLAPGATNLAVWEWDGTTNPGAWASIATTSPPSNRSWMTATYVPPRQSIAVMGGTQSVTSDFTGNFEYVPLTQTWTARAAIPPVGTAQGRSFHATAFDAARGRVLLSAGLRASFSPARDLLSFDVAANTWAIDRDLPNSPPPRVFAAMAFDEDNGRAIMAGGLNVMRGGDRRPLLLGISTYTFDGTTWGTAGLLPETLWKTPMVFIPGRSEMLIYGGEVSNSLVVSAQVWRLTLNSSPTWSVLTTAAPAGRRAMHSAAYDRVRQRIVYFGGRDETGARRNDTWLLNPADSSWMQAMTASMPSPRTGAAMAFDQRRGVVVLFGGSTADGVYSGETWEYDGIDWRNVTPIYGSPSPRSTASLVYVPDRGTLLLTGGEGTTARNSAGIDDVHEFDGTAWRLVSPPSSAGIVGTAYASHTYDTTRGRLLRFGGTSITFADINTNPYYWFASGQTWTFDMPSIPVLTSHPIAPPHCRLDSLQLSVTSNTPRVTFVWLRNGVPIPTSTNPTAASATLTLTALGPSDNGVYECVVTNECGSSRSQAATILVCAPDFNCSGSANTADIFDFLNAWFTSDPRANFDGLGGIDAADIFAFLNAWFAGC